MMSRTEGEKGEYLKNAVGEETGWVVLGSIYQGLICGPKL